MSRKALWQALMVALVALSAAVFAVPKASGAETQVRGICTSNPGSSPPYACGCSFELAYECDEPGDCFDQYPELCEEIET